MSKQHYESNQAMNDHHVGVGKCQQLSLNSEKLLHLLLLLTVINITMRTDRDKCDQWPKVRTHSHEAHPAVLRAMNLPAQ